MSLALPFFDFELTLFCLASGWVERCSAHAESTEVASTEDAEEKEEEAPAAEEEEEEEPEDVSSPFLFSCVLFSLFLGHTITAALRMHTAAGGLSV